MSTIDEMLKNATAQAEQTPEAPVQTVQLPAVTAPATKAVATYDPRDNFDLDAIDSGSLAVDAWLKVTTGGLYIKEKMEANNLKSEIKATLNLTDCQVKDQLNVGASYYSTYDGITEVKTGVSWQELVAKSASIAAPYKTVDVLFTLDEDIKKGKDVVVPKGTKIGYTLPKTGLKGFRAAKAKIDALGKREEAVSVTLGFDVGESKSFAPWGILTITVNE